MRGRARMNAMRSGLVVVCALAFGYLNLQLGFRPFLEKAQRTLESQQQQQQQPPFESESESQQSFDFLDSSSTVQD